MRFSFWLSFIYPWFELKDSAKSSRVNPVKGTLAINCENEFELLQILVQPKMWLVTSLYLIFISFTVHLNGDSAKAVNVYSQFIKVRLEQACWSLLHLLSINFSCPRASDISRHFLGFVRNWHLRVERGSTLVLKCHILINFFEEGQIKSYNFNRYDICLDRCRRFCPNQVQGFALIF